MDEKELLIYQCTLKSNGYFNFIHITKITEYQKININNISFAQLFKYLLSAQNYNSAVENIFNSYNQNFKYISTNHLII